MQIDAIRYFGMSDFLEIDRMTPREYRIRTLAARLKDLDSDCKIHRQAFANQAVQSTDKKGNMKYKKFEDFFNYKEEQNKILGIKTETKVDSKIVELIKIANK